MVSPSLSPPSCRVLPGGSWRWIQASWLITGAPADHTLPSMASPSACAPGRWPRPDPEHRLALALRAAGAGFAVEAKRTRDARPPVQRGCESPAAPHPTRCEEKGRNSLFRCRTTSVDPGQVISRPSTGNPFPPEPTVGNGRIGSAPFAPPLHSMPISISRVGQVCRNARSPGPAGHA